MPASGSQIGKFALLSSRMTPPEDGARHRRQRIGLVLGIVLFLIVLVAPAPAGMAPEAKRVAAVSLLMAVWWMSEAVDIAVTALLPLMLFPALGVMSSAKVAPYYTDQVIFLFFGGFVVALAIQKWNLHRRIALHTIRLVGVEPARMVLGFMIATGFLSMWISNTACTLMMLPIGISVVLQFATNQEEAKAQEIKDSFGSILMLAIAYSASIGGIATLIGTPTNLVFTGALRNLFPTAPEVPFLRWMLVGIPLVVVFLPIAWWYLCRFGSKVSIWKLRFDSGQSVVEDELRAMGKITRQEKYVLVIWGLMAFLWIFRSPIRLGALTVPGWSQLFGQPAYLQDATVAMAMALLLFVIPVPVAAAEPASAKHYEALMDWHTVQRGVPWGILFLFGGGFALAGAFEESKLSDWFGTQVSGLSGLPPIVVVLIVCVGLVFLTEFTSNTATALMAMPVLAAAAIQMGVHPFLLMIPGAISTSCAFMLPVATPPNAIVFGSGWLTIPQMARVGLALEIIGIILVTAVVYFVGMPVFGITVNQLPTWVH
jgi:solute carrier family 13 (sodium-dependent dicarboxylate transporter), member 2/3/5